jgi:hypothetical protein
MIETHAPNRTRRAPRPRTSASSAPQVADLTMRLTLTRAELEATRSENDRLRRSGAQLQAENTSLVTQLKQRQPAPSRRSAMRDALLDPCSLNP